MCGESGTGKKGTVYHYYKCANAKKTHTCDKKTVRKDFIENTVVKAVMAKIMDDELMEQLSYTLYDLQLQSSTILLALKQQLSDVNTGIQRMLDAIQQGVAVADVKNRLEELEARQKELEIEIADEQIKAPILTQEQIYYALTKYRSLDLSTQKGKQALIDSFVNTIYLYDDYAIITCNYKDGEEKITFEDIENSELGTIIEEQKNKPERECSDLFAFGDPVGVKGELFSSSNVTVLD